MTAARSIGQIIPGPKASPIEATLALHIRVNKLPEPIREFRFDAVRKWRSDFAWPDLKLLVECEGGEHTRGRHTRGTGFTKDCEKYNEAALKGWTVLRFTGSMIRSGAAIEAIQRFLGGSA
jgi:very-short-patch-repair endonuclease